MKNILYTIILSFLFSSSVFADLEAGWDACYFLQKPDANSPFS